MKSNIIPIYKEGQICILTVDKEINDGIIKKGSKVIIESIELTDSKFAELDEIYLVDYCDMTFWCYQTDLNYKMKSIEESAREYARNLSSSEIFQSQHEKDFKSGVEFAQRLIPVGKELPKCNPDNSDDVLCLCSNGDFIVGWYTINGLWRNTFNEDDENVTHWRPIKLI